MNDFFVNIGPKLAQSIPPSDNHFSTFLANPNPKSIFFAPTLETEIMDIVNNLKTQKSPGHDGITNKLLKHVIMEIVTPITHIFNLSITCGVVPSQMKKAKVIPIFKKGDTRERGNYRPISLLTSFSKILERIIYTRTIKFVHDCNIFSDSQYGFREKHKTTDALLILTDKVAKAIDSSSHTIGIFLDFSKAFDTINHDILLYKLSHYGIRRKALEWFRNYLKNRTQYVSVNDCESHLEEITCGVPQGSLLGPLLFILYINDFKRSSNMLSFILFADDSNIFLSHRDPRILVNTMNSELKSVHSWIQANKLSLNLTKTNYMLFSNSIQTLPGDININGVNIESVQSTKFLGIFIDNKLSWKTHVDKICRVISRNIGVINKLKRYFPHRVLLTLHSTLILPYLNYGILSWGNSQITQSNRILLLQKRALRIIENVHFRSHTDPLFLKNKILKIHDLYLLNLGAFMFQLFNNEVPPSVTLFFTRSNEIHQYPTRHALQNQYYLSLMRTAFAPKTLPIPDQTIGILLILPKNALKQLTPFGNT